MIDLIDVYPFNLAKDIFCDEDKAKKLYVGGIEIGLSTLTDRERKILELRYKEKLTLEQCGKIEGVTKERIRQIQAKALRKLRQPSRIAKMKAYKYEDIVKNAEEFSRLKEENKNLEKAIRLYTNKKVDKNELKEMARLADVMSLTLEDLDFSVRTYNCLKRKNVNYLKDIIEMTETDLKGVRNLGAKSRLEVMNKLNKYGVKLKEEIL